MTVEPILRLLSGLRLPLSREKRTQEAMETAFTDAGINAQREVRLSQEDVIDFTVGGIGIEVKLHGSRMEIFRQVERYAKHDAIESLILVTNVPTGFPPEVNGKPVYLVNLAKAWL